jgi:hypothetical protein
MSLTGDPLPLSSFALLLSFLFDKEWTAATQGRSTTQMDGAGPSSTRLGTLGHLLLPTKKRLIEYLYRVCNGFTGDFDYDPAYDANDFDMTKAIKPLINAIHGTTASEDEEEVLDQARAKMTSSARRFLRNENRNGEARDKLKSSLNRSKRYQLTKYQRVLGDSVVVLGANSPCEKVLAKLEQRPSCETYVLVEELRNKAELRGVFAGVNAGHRLQCILAVEQGTGVRSRLPSAYQMDPDTVGEPLARERAGDVVLLRVVQEEVGELSIYYSGMYYVACSANMLLWVWDYVASQSSYQALKQMAERVVSGTPAEGDFEGDADDVDFATFVRAEKRLGFTHGSKSLCMACAAARIQNQKPKPEKKKKQKQKRG